MIQILERQIRAPVYKGYWHHTEEIRTLAIVLAWSCLAGSFISTHIQKKLERLKYDLQWGWICIWKSAWMTEIPVQVHSLYTRRQCRTLSFCIWIISNKLLRSAFEWLKWWILLKITEWPPPLSPLLPRLQGMLGWILGRKASQSNNTILAPLLGVCIPIHFK